MSNRVEDFLIQEMNEQANSYNMLREVFYERSQSYGSLIKMMLDSGVNEATISYDDLDFTNKYLLAFIPNNETREFTLKLTDNPDYKEKKKDE